MTKSRKSTRFKSFSIRRPRFWRALILLMIILVIVRFCSYGSDHHAHPQLPVVTAQAKKADVPVYLNALGNVASPKSITVKTQVNGLLMRVNFKEGQFVKAGDILAEIDTRPFEAQLKEYQGQLQRDQALLENARIDQARYEKLWKQNSIAKQVLDTQVALVHQYEGTVQLDEGLLDMTKVNLIYCHIQAPVDGQVGILQVDPGNFVQTSDANGIVILNAVNPIEAVFTLPEEDVPQIQQVKDPSHLVVFAFDRLNQKMLSHGVLYMMDNQIDPTTGTVKLKAFFDNTDSHLFVNQFINVRLLLKILHQVVVVPNAAIQHATDGDHVFVVNADSTVSMKTVKTSVTEGENIVVSTGVNAGDNVVTEGADKLSDGVAVTVSDPSAAALPDTPAHKARVKT